MILYLTLHKLFSNTDKFSCGLTELKPFSCRLEDYVTSSQWPIFLKVSCFLLDWKTISGSVFELAFSADQFIVWPIFVPLSVMFAFNYKQTTKKWFMILVQKIYCWLPANKNTLQPSWNFVTNQLSSSNMR